MSNALIYLNPQKFKVLCKRKHFSLRILADLASVNKKTILDYWNGTRGCRPKTFEQLAEVLGWEEMKSVVQEGLDLAEKLHQKKLKEKKEKEEKVFQQKHQSTSSNVSLKFLPNFCRGYLVSLSEKHRTDLYKEANGKCHNPLCLSTAYPLEIHYIIPDKAGELPPPEDTIALCRNCHWEADNGILSPRDLRQYKMGVGPVHFSNEWENLSLDDLWSIYVQHIRENRNIPHIERLKKAHVLFRIVSKSSPSAKRRRFIGWLLAEHAALFTALGTKNDLKRQQSNRLCQIARSIGENIFASEPALLLHTKHIHAVNLANAGQFKQSLFEFSDMVKILQINTAFDVLNKAYVYRQYAISLSRYESAQSPLCERYLNDSWIIAQQSHDRWSEIETLIRYIELYTYQKNSNAAFEIFKPLDDIKSPVWPAISKCMYYRTAGRLLAYTGDIDHAVKSIDEGIKIAKQEKLHDQEIKLVALKNSISKRYL